MSFDLSRIRFDARRDFLGVIMQQGRVQLDADWNEWVAQLGRRLQAGTLDTFGGSVVPRTTPDGFLIQATGGGFTIGRGRIYVDGLLAENHGAGEAAWDDRLAEPTGSTAVDYAAQPYYPDPPALPAEGRHLVYVDVWQRDLTAVQAPDLIEQAVGVDTTGRRQTVWQVKLLPDIGNAGCSSADEDVPGWAAITAPSPARLSTTTGTPDFTPNPCEVPPAAGYLGLENQLYRVEVHTGGVLGTATFKWSRDNATVASRVTHINAARTRITVESVGRDDVLRFNDGDWVEITDDWRELKNLPGEMRRLRVPGGVDDTARTLEFDTPLPAGMFPTDAQHATQAQRNTRVRRWDQADAVRREDGTLFQDLDNAASHGTIRIPAAGTRLFLEHGVLVEFSLAAGGGHFRSGDHWVFAARTVDASIERLDHAPPLGIRHHYARLAVVTFPSGEDDCRTLWPPLQEGEGCDCSVCVSAEGHNSGVATIQQAIDSIKDHGGTVCLGIGEFRIAAPLTISGARSLRIRGQGWATLLTGAAPGSLFELSASTGVALENLSALGSGGNSGTTAVIAAHNVVDLRIEHVNVLGVAVGDGTSVGIGLSGFALATAVRDCAVVAERGIATLARERQRQLLSAELRITDNILLCGQRAISFDATTLHYGTTRLDHNLMLLCTDASVVATGGVLPGSSVSVADNVMYTMGDGVRAGVDGLALERNEITGLGARNRNGIVLQEGLDPVALDRVRIVANRLSLMRGNGIAIRHRVEDALIADNLIDATGQAGLLMEEGGAAGYLMLRGNAFRRLGLLLEDAERGFAGVQLVDITRGDVLDNLIADVAREAANSPGVDGLRALAIGELRIAGNRLHGIGPDRIGGPVAAIRLLPPFDRVAIDDNTLDRVSGPEQKPVMAQWWALLVAIEPRGAAGELATATHHYGISYLTTAAESAYLLTANRVRAIALTPSNLSIRGNRMRGQQSAVPLVQCLQMTYCLFADNHCEAQGEGGRGPVIGQIGGRSLNASHHHLRGPGDTDTLHLLPERKQAIVIGNTSSGNIRVPSGAPVPADISLTNIIGI